MRSARSLSWSSTEMPRISLSEMIPSTSGGVKPGGGPEVVFQSYQVVGGPKVQTVPSGVGRFSWRCRLLFTASSSRASRGTSPTRVALPFFSARRAAFAVSSREVVAFEVAFLGAIAGMVCGSTNGGRQMLENVGTHRHMARWVQTMRNGNTLMLINATG